MGAVACERHGTQLGLLCCDHVRNAAHHLGPDVAFANYGFDVLGGGNELLEHLICESCAEKFQLDPSQPIPENVLAAEGLFPYVCPTCVHCLARWAEKHNKPFQSIAHENARSS